MHKNTVFTYTMLCGCVDHKRLCSVGQELRLHVDVAYSPIREHSFLLYSLTSQQHFWGLYAIAFSEYMSHLGVSEESITRAFEHMVRERYSSTF